MKAVIHHSVIHDDATIHIPSSKSLSHRAVICAALANGTSKIYDLADNNDLTATKRDLENLGVTFVENETHLEVIGNGGKMKYDHSVIDCGESGSTLRFLIPIAGLSNEKISFTGHGKLMERPLGVYEKLFKEQGLLFEKQDSVLTIQGPLQGGEFSIQGDVSSQFITGLLFALPLCQNDSILHIIPPFESASYVDLTLDYLNQSGIEIQKKGYDFIIPGKQSYKRFEGVVEGDDSQMAFFLELAGVQKRPVKILNIRHHSLQGDHVMLRFVEKMGAKVEEIENGYIVSCDTLHGIDADLADCPDLGPALFALATQCESESKFYNCGRLRIKESDRIACMEEELRKLGCDIHSEGDTVIVRGKTGLMENVQLNGHNDHRIVMALSVLASISDNVTIHDAQAITKSYPNFFEDISQLGVEVEI